jgi:hypothetical protein
MHQGRRPQLSISITIASLANATAAILLGVQQFAEYLCLSVFQPTGGPSTRMAMEVSNAPKVPLQTWSL